MRNHKSPRTRGLTKLWGVKMSSFRILLEWNSWFTQKKKKWPEKNLGQQWPLLSFTKNYSFLLEHTTLTSPQISTCCHFDNIDHCPTPSGNLEPPCIEFYAFGLWDEAQADKETTCKLHTSDGGCCCELTVQLHQALLFMSIWVNTRKAQSLNSWILFCTMNHIPPSKMFTLVIFFLKCLIVTNNT